MRRFAFPQQRKCVEQHVEFNYLNEISPAGTLGSPVNFIPSTMSELFPLATRLTNSSSGPCGPNAPRYKPEKGSVFGMFVGMREKLMKPCNRLNLSQKLQIEYKGLTEPSADGLTKLTHPI